ncbi:hypothetical protein ACP3P6_23360 [Enterobacter mori]
MNGVQDEPSVYEGKSAPGGVTAIKVLTVFFRANDARQDIEWQHQSESIYLMENIAYSFCALDNPVINRGINPKRYENDIVRKVSICKLSCCKYRWIL